MISILKRMMSMGLVVALCLTTIAANTGVLHSSPQTDFSVTNLNDSGMGSLRQAIIDANNTPGTDLITITANGQLDLASDLPIITDAVTLFVPDANISRVFEIDGQNLYRGLTIANVPVTITGVTVQNSIAIGTLPGGGILSDGDLILNDVMVLNSTAGSVGGGVSSTGSVIVNGGRYEGNRATDGGGAIYAGGPLVVNGSTISHNACTAIYVCNGGGLYADNTLTLTNTQIVSNTAENYGGGVYTVGATQIKGGSFEDNLSIQYGGGGIFATNAFVLTGTVFISNTAIGAGGGGAAVFGPGPVRLTNAYFENNRSLGGDGGGGMVTYTTITATLTNVDFAGNHAQGGGGGLRASNVFINGGIFEQNTSSGSGGGLFANTVVLTDTQIISNTAVNVGGARVTNLVATAVLFTNNSSSIGAGGLSSDQAAIFDSQFIHNSGGSGGGLQTTSDLTITNSEFTHNNGDIGGAVQATGGLTITATLFLGNEARLGGGVAHYVGDGLMVNTLFARNHAADKGAAIYLQGSGTDDIKHVTIANSTLVTKTAVTTAKEIVLLQNTIVANHVTGLEVTTGFVVLNNTLFDGNGLDIQGTVAFDENRVSGDPLFVNPDVDDYHLQAGSPAIDTGRDGGITVDIEGDLRPSLNGFDIGYDEMVGFRIMLPLIRH